MPKSRPLEERFWEKVNVLSEDECWEWTGATVVTGERHVNPLIYGRIAASRVPGKPRKIWTSHRLSWTIKNGLIPEGMFVDHRCHNTLCVNPKHLRCVTPKQNSENRIGPSATNTSGIRGVRWNKEYKKWVGYFTHNRKSYYVGSSDDKEELGERVKEARKRFFTHNDSDYED